MPSASVNSVMTSSISLITCAPTLSMRSVVLMWEIGFVDLLEVGLGQFAVVASVSLTILLNGGLYPVA
jgi:hypothetical protein